MIKMGKMKVNENVSPKTFFWIMIFSIIIFAYLTIYNICNYINTKDYIKVEATITWVGTEYINESDSTYSYIEYKYEYGEEDYTNKQRVAFRFNKKVGETQNIHINPNNPSEVKDTYMTNTSLIICGIMFVITIFMIKGYSIRKNIE